MKDMVNVIKRDGSKEAYDETKVVRVVVAAGAKNGQEQVIAQAVTAWLNKEKLTETTSLIIRDKVISELKKINPEAANFFIWYQKTL